MRKKSKCRVLLAEDSPISRELLRELLQMLHVSVFCAEDGKEAFQLFKDARPKFFDLLIFDIEMPNLSGEEAAGLIRQLDRPDALDVPIVAITADFSDEDEIRMKKTGMNECLRKPVSVPVLADLIQKYTE